MGKMVLFLLGIFCVLGAKAEMAIALPDDQRQAIEEEQAKAQAAAQSDEALVVSEEVDQDISE